MSDPLGEKTQRTIVHRLSHLVRASDGYDPNNFVFYGPFENGVVATKFIATLSGGNREWGWDQIREAPKPKVTLESIIDDLEALGSPLAIADNLGAAGYKGEPGEPTSCPIAKYATAKLGRPVSTSTYRSHLDFEDVSVDHGPNVKAFVATFDTYGRLVG